MKNSEIFKKTMPFVWTRFLLYFLLSVGLIVYYILVILLFAGLASGSVGVILLIVASLFGIAIFAYVSRYINYMVKAAHIAVITELSLNGTIPNNESMVKYGQAKVKERFAAANVFFVLDGLVSGAVSQIQNVVNKIGGLFGNIPAIENIVSIINLFIGVVLGYVDEAVLSYIFLHKGESAWKGAADGVVLYFQNWKEILKNAVGIVVGIIAFYIVAGLGLFGVIYGLIGALTDSNFIIILISIICAAMLVLSVKESFIDSYVTISVINKYMTTTYGQSPNFDLYGKAKGWSKKFTKIVTNAEAEGATVGTVAGGEFVAPPPVVPPRYANASQQMAMGSVPSQPIAPQPMVNQQPLGFQSVAQSTNQPVQPVSTEYSYDVQPNQNSGQPYNQNNGQQ